MPSGYASPKGFNVHASRLFQRNLKTSRGVTFVSCDLRRLPSFASRGSVSSACSAGKPSSSSCSLRSSSAFRLGGMTLNIDEFRVMDLKPSLAVSINPFFSSTTRGSEVKGVLSLSVFFGCLTSIVSPGLISLGFVPSFESAYVLILDFCSASLSAVVFRVSCKVWCLAGAGDTSGRAVLSFLPFSASLGDTFVVVYGVARYCMRNLYSSCFQFLPSTTAVHTHFSRFGMKRSASPFALGQRGWTFP